MKKLWLAISICALAFNATNLCAAAGTASVKTPSIARPSTDVLTPDERVNINVYNTANKSVVYITTVNQTEDMFFRAVPSQGEGSGCILTADGFILTNYHVVKDANPNMLRVTLWDGTQLPAEITGTDPEYDIAVLKVNPGNKQLIAIKLGDSTNLEVGRRVFVIGNPFGFDRTMTSGIISMLGRSITSVGGKLIKGIIQTDAAINPGNSGGPLLNSRAEMIGVTTAIYSRLGGANAQCAGIGFAIPVNVVKRIFPELIAHHRVIRPDLGIKLLRPVTVNLNGQTIKALQVVNIDPQGAGAKAGLSGLKVTVRQQGPFSIRMVDNQSSDFIVRIDNSPTASADDLLSYLENKKAGQVVTLTVIRQGKFLKIPVKLSSNDPN